MATKKWYKSKTMWVNAIGFILASLELIDVNILGVIGVKDPIKAMAIIGLAASLLNLYLRTLGGDPIKTKKSVKKPKISTDEKNN